MVTERFQENRGADPQQPDAPFGKRVRRAGALVDDADFAKQFPGMERLHHKALGAVAHGADAYVTSAANDGVNRVGCLAAAEYLLAIAWLHKSAARLDPI